MSLPRLRLGMPTTHKVSLGLLNLKFCGRLCYMHRLVTLYLSMTPARVPCPLQVQLHSQKRISHIFLIQNHARYFHLYLRNSDKKKETHQGEANESLSKFKNNSCRIQDEVSFPSNTREFPW